MSGKAQVVYGGVDTHRDVHVAAVVDTAGRVLGSAPFRADVAGYVMTIIESPQSRSSKIPTLGSVILGWLVSFRSVFSGLGLV